MSKENTGSVPFSRRAAGGRQSAADHPRLPRGGDHDGNTQARLPYGGAGAGVVEEQGESRIKSSY